MPPIQFGGAEIEELASPRDQGVEFSAEPTLGDAPLVCDASSNFLSRPIQVGRYGLIYACAQKNAGIAGVTVVIVRNDLLERVPKGLPSMLDYRLQAANDSLYNTPPVFAIYVLVLVARWLKNDVGGLAKMQTLNRDKAKILYDVLDAYPHFYRGHARRDSRSTMNVTWRLPSEELEEKFRGNAALCLPADRIAEVIKGINGLVSLPQLATLTRALSG